MSSQMLTRTSRPALDARARGSLFRRLFGAGQRRRRTFVPLAPDQY
jgi:hypothetical protein